jgi:hypothetical protein
MIKVIVEGSGRLAPWNSRLSIEKLNVRVVLL